MNPCVRCKNCKKSSDCPSYLKNQKHMNLFAFYVTKGYELCIICIVIDHKKKQAFLKKQTFICTPFFHFFWMKLFDGVKSFIIIDLIHIDHGFQFYEIYVSISSIRSSHNRIWNRYRKQEKPPCRSSFELWPFGILHQ